MVVLSLYAKDRKKTQTFLHHDWFLARKSSHLKNIHKKSKCQSHQNSNNPVYIFIRHVLNISTDPTRSFPYPPSVENNNKNLNKITEQRGLERPCGKLISETCRQNVFFLFSSLKCWRLRPKNLSLQSLLVL